MTWRRFFWKEVGMDISTTDSDGIYTLHISGRLDTLTAPAFEEPFAQALREHPTVVLDCAQLDYISSAGLRVLLAGQKLAAAAEHSLILSSVSDEVREVFDMTGFSNILTIQ
jgi:anti-anti-sigma factor